MSKVRLFLIKKILRNIKKRVDYTDLISVRKHFDRTVSKWNPKMSGFTYTSCKIGEMEAEWILPDGGDEKSVLLYFHGGGYATGSIDTHRALVSKLAENAGIKALIINYRLSPENKYPAPIEDATSAYQWLLARDFKPDKIAFGGDSAGGGITISTLAYLRDKKIPLPACAIALSPWLDLSLSGESYHTKKEHDPMLVHEGFPIWAESYLGGADTKSPYASPIFHSLQGFPPILVQVGEEEMLLSDSTRFAEKAKKEGVEVLLEIYSQKFHVFNAFWRVLPKARLANLHLGHFLKSHLQPTSAGK